MLLVLCGAALAVFVFRPNRTEQVPPPPAADTAATSKLGQFTALDPPLPAPALAFETRKGTVAHLADFRGQFVLLNLWATWCVPCIEEMPSLDRLQAKLGKRLRVLAVSQDRRGAAAVDPFLAQHDIKNLTVGLDPKNAAVAAFHVEGLPTSFLISRKGMILGSLIGSADWDAPKMLAVLDRYLDAK